MRFSSQQDWYNYLTSHHPNLPTPEELLNARKNCYSEIQKIRGIPLLIYATKFLDNHSGAQNTIDLSDVEGFVDLVNSVSDTEEIDVILHSPGGRPDATERIVHILRGKFNKVNFLIPHSAYSAATMLALSGNKIILHPNATLGPIDPQINGIPARSIKRGFEKVKEVIRNEGPESLPAYIPLIEKYTLDLLELCEDSEKLSRTLVSDWLHKYMFEGKKGSSKYIRKAVHYFSNYDEHLLHSRPLVFSKISNFNLQIEISDSTLSPLLWEAFILINGFFSISPFVKLFENVYGVSYGRQQIQIPIAPQLIPRTNL